MTDRCLHCAITQLINDHAREHAPKHEGTCLPVVSLHDTLTAVAQVLGGLIAHIPDEEQRRGAIGFAGQIASKASVDARRAEGCDHASGGLH